MKKFAVMFSMLLLYLFVSGPAFSQGATAFKGTASEVRGKPEVTPDGRKEGVIIKDGTQVSEGDTILAGFGESLTLTFDDGTVTYVQPISQIVVTRSYVEKEAARIHLKLNFGAVRATVPKKEARTDFTISTPTVVCSVKGTEIKEVRANIDMPDIIIMGRIGQMRVTRNPSMNLSGNEGTNSNFINPIDFSRDNSWVSHTQYGNTDEENEVDKLYSTPLYTNPPEYFTSPSQEHSSPPEEVTPPPPPPLPPPPPPPPPAPS